MVPPTSTESSRISAPKSSARLTPQGHSHQTRSKDASSRHRHGIRLRNADHIVPTFHASVSIPERDVYVELFRPYSNSLVKFGPPLEMHSFGPSKIKLSSSLVATLSIVAPDFFRIVSTRASSSVTSSLVPSTSHRRSASASSGYPAFTKSSTAATAGPSIISRPAGIIPAADNVSNRVTRFSDVIKRGHHDTHFLRLWQ